MSPASAYASYRNAEITTLNQRDLIVKLYQGAERFLLQGASHLEEGHRAKGLEAAHKARAIISELLATLDLDRGGDVARQLQSLYTFCITHILDATAKRDGAELRKLLPILANLREAWQQIPDDIARTGGSGNAVDIRR